MPALIHAEPQIITPRRNFLMRAFGFTVAGATIPIPVVVADDAEKRARYHLNELAKALQEQYPGCRMVGGLKSHEAWRDLIEPGEIAATVRAA